MFKFNCRPTAASTFAGVMLALSAAGPVLAQPADSGRVIVQFRSAGEGADKQALAADRVASLSARTGLALAVQTGPAPELKLISAPGVDAKTLAERLAAQPDVAYAEPDGRKQIRRAPNDPRFADQWLLQAAQPSSIRAESAWDITTGSTSTVIAVVDTGVRFDHEDLAASFLPGYDFIADQATAGDGGGRDADASDAGDFLSAADLQSPNFAGCSTSPTESSWHGTRVSGVAAALGNNSRGVAGVSWNARVLPVRVLGKCGGYDSDVLAGMRWAGGLTVEGAPQNPNPARIINLSLGSVGACTQAYRDTIAALNAAGVIVVTAAGNAGSLVETPGNCPGVISVAGLRHVGTKVGYSSHGPEVTISAPAGNCGDDTANPACVYQIPTTTNLGTTVPGANGYSDPFNATYGTSFSTPQVSGTVALMLAVHPQLGANAVSERLQATARTFPVVVNVPVCPLTEPETGQCACTTSTCGAGMLDAAGAVQAALQPAAAPRLAGQPGRVVADGSASSASAGRSISAWQWSAVDGPGALVFAQPNAASSGIQAAVAGTYRVRLTVTDSAGGRDETLLTFALDQPSVAEPAPGPTPQPTPAPTPTPNPGGGGGGGTPDLWSLLGVALLAAGARQVSRRRRGSQAVIRPPM